MGAKTCLNCIHGSKVINEDTFPERTFKPYSIECARSRDIGDLGNKYNWNEFYMPEVCGQYQPTMVDCCAYCKSLINMEVYLWDKWAGINGKPVCSSDCRIKLEGEEIGNLFYD